MTREELKKQHFDTRRATLIKNIACHHYQGRGSTAKAREFVDTWLGKPCPYCGVLLTVDNLQLEHAIPLQRKKIEKGYFTEKEVALLNSFHNKIGSCAGCNAAKGDLDAYEYKTLLAYLTTFEQVCKHHREKATLSELERLSPGVGSKAYILRRMKSSGRIY